MKPRPVQSSGYTKERKPADRGPRTWKVGTSLSIALIAVLTASRSYPQQPNGQEPPPKHLISNPKMTRPPLSHIYRSFLLYQNHLDRAAAKHEEEGKDGSWLRDHFQRKLGFTDSEFAVVRATGLRLESELKEIGSEAMAIAKADRAAGLEHSSAPRLPNPKLQDLTNQREEIIQREVTDMNRELGPVPAAKLQAFLENDFLHRATLLPPHPHPHTLKRLPPQSGQQAAQP